MRLSEQIKAVYCLGQAKDLESFNYCIYTSILPIVSKR